MKSKLDDSLKALAEVKAMAIRSRNDIETYSEKAKNYEQKAMLILKKAGEGDFDAAEADRLATEALSKKTENEKLKTQAEGDKAKFEDSVSQLDANIKKIRSNISSWEGELKTLKARVKVSKATSSLNKQLAQIDSSDTVSMLERMKEKVDQEEALAESYGEIAHESRSIDEELDQALEGSQAQASDDLAALKAKMGLNKDTE